MKLIDRIKNNKILYFLGVLIVGIFIVLIVRFTYAYLAANVNEASGNVIVDSDETDNLKFEIGGPLSINATPTTLPENGENLVDTTTATAKLLANETNNTAEYNYWVYFTISNNTFIYSDGSTPEIILTVTDPEGNPVTNIEGLTYGTFNGVAGFDVTTQNGTFTVANGHTITSNSSTEKTNQTWTLTLTYLNLSFDQSANYGNSMTTEVKMQKEANKVLFADYIMNTVYTGTDGENDLYYHDGNIEVGVCTYNGFDVYTYFNLENPSTSQDNCSRIYYMSQGDIYFDASVENDAIIEDVEWNSAEQRCKTVDSASFVFADLNGNLDFATEEQCQGFAVDTDGSGVFTINVGSGTMGNKIGFDASDNSYRYAGADPNNYVCFGSDAEVCPEDNLYRIIGVFDEDSDGEYNVKLIKADYTTSEMLGTDGRDYYGSYSISTSNYKGSMDTSTIAGYRWNYDTSVSTLGSNDWTTSEFNKINLNTNYLNNIGSDWSNLIATTTWKVGGNTYDNISEVTVKNTYTNEIVSPVEETTYEAKIGLMYVSDYGYAASPENWTTTLNNYNNETNRNNNWMFMGLYEWTITPCSSDSDLVFSVYDDGSLYEATADSDFSARPVFYLNSNVKLEGGSGTASDPYRLAA